MARTATVKVVVKTEVARAVAARVEVARARVAGVGVARKALSS